MSVEEFRSDAGDALLEETEEAIQIPAVPASADFSVPEGEPGHAAEADAAAYWRDAGNFARVDTGGGPSQDDVILDCEHSIQGDMHIRKGCAERHEHVLHKLFRSGDGAAFRVGQGIGVHEIINDLRIFEVPDAIKPLFCDFFVSHV